jgi:hypothetical protein
LTKARAVQTQLDTLSDWIAELGENIGEDLNRVVPFEYSAELTAALELHGLDRLLGDGRSAFRLTRSGLGRE